MLGFLATAETQDYPSKFDDTIRMNLRSAFLMTKYALPHLQKFHGNIVSAGSEAGFNGIQHALRRYQGWMHSFMKGVAVEQVLCPRQLRSSRPIDTAWTHKETGPMDGKMEKMLIQATPGSTRHHRGSCKRLRLYRLP